MSLIQKIAKKIDILQIVNWANINIFYKIMNQGKIKCPDCENFIERQDLKNHIVSCKAYKPNLLNSIIKLTEHLN